MRKSLFKRSLSILLSVCMILSMTAVSLSTVSAATSVAQTSGLTSFVLDKVAEIGLRKACNAIVAISESAEENGNEEIARVTGMIAEWGLMSAEEAATTKNIEICEEILYELNELSTMTENGMKHISSEIAKLGVDIKADELSDEMKYDVDLVISEVSEESSVLKDYDNYVAVAKQYSDNQATNEELQKAQLKFLLSLRSYLGITKAVDETSLEAVSKQVFGDIEKADAINQRINSIISKLSAKLVPTSTDATTVMSQAMELAYVFYPFSHQQYDLVVSEVGVQINTLVKVMCMYNEILALQCGYLNNSTEISESDKSALLNTYDITVERYRNDLMPSVIDNIDTMLSSDYLVDIGVVLSIDDYMKSDDAVPTRLKINEYSGNDNIENYNNYYRLMTHNGNTKNVAYLWAGDSFVSRNYRNSSADDRGVTNTYNSLKSSVNDGCNNFVIPTAKLYSSGGVLHDDIYTVDKYNSFFNKSVFAMYNYSIGEYFYDYSDNTKHKLINATYLFTPEYSTKLSGTEAEFYLFNVNDTYTDFSVLKTSVYEWGSDSSRLTALYTPESTYKQNLKVEIVSDDSSQLAVSVDNTTVNNGGSATIESGKILSIEVQVPKDKKFTLTCTRDYNTFDSSLDMTSDVVLLDDKMMKFVCDSEDSEYYYATIEYTMPYSDTKLTLDINDFEYDSEGNIVIASYDDLKKVSDYINASPQNYASKSYVVTSNFTVPDNSELSPIGKSSTPFTGTFDGQNHTITNLNFSQNNTSAGLFAYSNGVIKNVVIDSAKISATETAGGICGKSETGTISNCVVKNSDISGYYSGGIVGDISDTTIEKCANINTSVYAGAYSGGIVGVSCPLYNTSLTKECYNTGTVSGEMCGGIAGSMMMGAMMQDCYNIGKVTGTDLSGAILGDGLDILVPLIISNCYYNSDVDSKAIGSLADGKTDTSTIYSKTTEQFKTGEVAYSLNSGVVDGTQVWYQDLDNIKYEADEYPSFENNGWNTVYKVDREDRIYSNQYFDYLLGDVDNDGSVTVMDATLIQKHLVKSYTITGVQLLAADTDKDHTVSVSDATRIQIYLASIITEL